MVVPALVIGARVLLHGIGKVSLSGGMPAGLLEDKPNVAGPEDKVQKPKDLKENQSKRLKDWTETPEDSIYSNSPQCRR